MLYTTDVHSFLNIDLKLSTMMDNKPGFNFVSNTYDFVLWAWETVMWKNKRFKAEENGKLFDGVCDSEILKRVMTARWLPSALQKNKLVLFLTSQAATLTSVPGEALPSRN